LEWRVVKHRNRKGMWGGNRGMEKYEFQRSGVWNAGIKQ
jgi:hypothetical protein